MVEVSIRSSRREEMLPLTRLLQQAARDNAWHDGALLVFCPHTTASLTINENSDPAVPRDMQLFMKRLVPEDAGFAHAEGNSDAHIKASLFGPHILLIVDKGQIRLGAWQDVYFCEWDGPRPRSLWLQFLPGAPSRL